jgi:hypothetical protein
VACSRRRAATAALITLGRAGAATRTLNAPEVATPGSGFMTVTLIVPADACEAVARSEVGQTNVVVRNEVAQTTTAPGLKLVPETEIVKFPVGMLVGNTEVRAGTGLSTVAVALPLAALSAALVASTDTGLGEGTLFGAR